jgi:GT2 family glycosyltransferase
LTSESKPRLSVVMVNYNGLRHLPECLSSLEAQTFQNFETIFVDNASKDDSIAFVETHFPSVRVVRSETNLGFAGGNNLGFQHCRADHVFLLNNDTRLDPKALENAARWIHELPPGSIFSCCMLQYEHPERIDSAGDTLYTNGATFNYRGQKASEFTQVREVTSACGGAAIYPKFILDRLNGFDEDFFLLLEDVDLSFRARHLGFKIFFLPDVKVYHKGSASIGGHESPTSHYFSERNGLWLYLKNFPISLCLRLFPHLLAMKCLRVWPFMRHGHFAIYFKANWHALQGARKMLRKRREILGASQWSSREMYRWLRKNWIRDRIRHHMGKPILD